MKIIKILISLVLTVTLASNSIIMASSQDNCNDNISDITVLYFDNYTEYEEHLESLANIATASDTAEYTSIYPVLIRYNEEKCELLLNWTGTMAFRQIRFKKITLKETNLLFPATYDILGTGSSYTYKHIDMTSTVGSMYIDLVEIPDDVTDVKFSSKGLQIYYVKESKWLSAIELSGTATIN